MAWNIVLFLRKIIFILVSTCVFQDEEDYKVMVLNGMYNIQCTLLYIVS